MVGLFLLESYVVPRHVKISLCYEPLTSVFYLYVVLNVFYIYFLNVLPGDPALLVLRIMGILSVAKLMYSLFYQ